MSSPTPDYPVAMSSPADRVFPALTPGQIARISARGRIRAVRAGEVLQMAGDAAQSLFVVTAGSVEIVRRSTDSEELVAALRQGRFTGETNLLSGRDALVTLRVRESGEVIEVRREDLLGLVQSDSELSDVFMRAFILRRVELIAHGFGAAVLIGSRFCQATLRVKEFLTRNGHPYTFVDLDLDSGVQDLLDRFGVGSATCPF